MNAQSSSQVMLARLGWFLHTQLKGNVELVSQRTGLAAGTLRRYMEHEPARLAEGFGPHRIPIVLRILDDLGVNPARLAVALHYSDDEPTFWRLLASTLHIEGRICLQAGPDGEPKVDCRLISLESEETPPIQRREESRRGRFTSVLHERLTWFLAQRIRGRVDELSAKAGVPPATLRRYAEVDGAIECRSGPQRVRPFLDILNALEVSPPKLVVAAHYGGNSDSFWMIMSSTLYAQETLKFCGPGDQDRVEKALHRLDDAQAPPSRGCLRTAWAMQPYS